MHFAEAPWDTSYVFLHLKFYFQICVDYLKANAWFTTVIRLYTELRFVIKVFYSVVTMIIISMKFTAYIYISHNLLRKYLSLISFTSKDLSFSQCWKSRCSSGL